MSIKNWDKYQEEGNPQGNIPVNPQDTNKNILNKNKYNKQAEYSSKNDSPEFEAYLDALVEKRKTQGINIRSVKAYKSRVRKVVRLEYRDIKKLLRREVEGNRLCQSSNSNDWTKGSKIKDRVARQLEGFNQDLVKLVKKEVVSCNQSDYMDGNE